MVCDRCKQKSKQLNWHKILLIWLCVICNREQLKKENGH